MSEVRLSGQLECQTQDEARLVVKYLPRHIALTRNEPGCISFEVTQTDDPLIWRVEERFENETAFRAHQDRVASSEWGRMTDGIQRRYSIAGLPR
jgi:quinol monooxygenase YgiN